MEITQKIARKVILNKFNQKLLKKEEYVVKSTGDGFLVAFKLEEGVEHLYEKRKNDRWKQCATNLVDGLKDLVRRAKPQKGASYTFGEHTYRFISNYGKWLGYSAHFLKDNRCCFRVAGAMAMGIGGLINDSSRDPEKWNDAYGHPINLAFRLCDKAGRLEEKGGDHSPLILLDRRTARLLMQENGGRFQQWKLVPHDHGTELKGIEETWCFGLREKNDARRRQLAKSS